MDAMLQIRDYGRDRPFVLTAERAQEIAADILEAIGE
jgi:hypothetical protein